MSARRAGVLRVGGRPSGRRRALLLAGGALLLAAVFAAGLALGMALHDNPRPTGPLTVESTVHTLP